MTQVLQHSFQGIWIKQAIEVGTHAVAAGVSRNLQDDDRRGNFSQTPP